MHPSPSATHYILISNVFQLVLNGNNVAWSTVLFLVKKLTNLDELHLSANNLQNPGNAVLEVRKINKLESEESLKRFNYICFGVCTLQCFIFHWGFSN